MIIMDQVKGDDGLLSLPVDFQQLRKICQVEEFYAALEVEPKEALSCMGAAVNMVQHQNCVTRLKFQAFLELYSLFKSDITL